MGKRKLHTGFWWRDLREGDNLGDPGVNGRIILKRIIQEVGWGMDWIELTQDRQVAGSCECGNKPPGSIKYAEFLD
jgi:hypothetical protein